MNILEMSKCNEQELVSIRRHLHQNPELSDVEWETLKFIREKLSDYDIPFIEVENGGILAFIGKQNVGKTVLLRGDIDALPMQESEYNTKQLKECPISKNQGVCHSCGHDAHTAMLLVAGKILKENERFIDGSVILCFERGEEGGDGCNYLLKCLEEEKIKVDVCHTLHVAPEVPEGTLSAQNGAVMAGSFSFEVTLTGAGGHGSRPDLANNPIDCFNAIYNDMAAVRMRKIDPFQCATFSICKIQSGGQWNIIPENLTFAGSARFFDREDIGMKFRKAFMASLEYNTKVYGCTYTFSRLSGPTLPVVNNNPYATLARNAYSKYLGERCLWKAMPQVSSESMAMYQRLYPGVYTFLGTGNLEKGMTEDVHSPRFDFVESVMSVGTAAHIAFVMECLSQEILPEFKRFNGTVSQLLDMLDKGTTEEMVKTL